MLLDLIPQILSHRARNPLENAGVVASRMDGDFYHEFDFEKVPYCLASTPFRGSITLCA